MRQNDHNSPSSQLLHLASSSSIRLIRGAACAAVLCLSVGMIAPAHGQAAPQTTTQDKKSKKKSTTPPKTVVTNAAARVVVVFPPETKGGVSDQIADVITEVVQARLGLSGKYKTTVFLPSAPTVKRAVIEGSVTKSEIDKPVANDVLIKKLTELTGHDMAFVVSIIDYQYDKAANKVSIVMSAKLLDYTGAPPHGTNRNGDSPDKPAPKATEYDLAAALARDLTEKMVTDILTPTKPTAPAEADKK